jgi:deazaflavin-dependent oxidoreductase (nitroreductase family)
MPKPPPPDSAFWKAFEVLAGLNVRLFKLTRGRIGGKLPGTSARILILHHVGRKSGTKRETPLLFVEDGDELAIIASKGGVDKHPAWFHNLTASPETLVELPGGEKRRVTAHVAEGEERERWWRRAVRVYKYYDDYASYTDRRIPVIVLEPVGRSDRTSAGARESAPA